MELAIRSWNQGVADALESFAETLEESFCGGDDDPAVPISVIIGLARVGARQDGRLPQPLP
jgi:hypothetical protein